MMILSSPSRDRQEYPSLDLRHGPVQPRCLHPHDDRVRPCNTIYYSCIRTVIYQTRPLSREGNKPLYQYPFS